MTVTHPDWPAFQNAIVADPDDDTVRLVAADFLDENGDPDRAAFIRVQIALAQLKVSGPGKSPEAYELRKKERVFLGPTSVYPHLWAAVECPELVRVITPSSRTDSPLSRLRVEGVQRLRWYRGFVVEINCPAAEWLHHGVAVRKRNPVEYVTLSGCERVTRDDWYAGLDALRGLDRVDLDFFATIQEFNEFLAWLRGWLPGTQVLQAIPF